MRVCHINNREQTHLQERRKNANKTYFMLQQSFKNKNISIIIMLKKGGWACCLFLKKYIQIPKIKTKEHNRQNISICIRHTDPNKDRLKANEDS
jgi:hypothetical protein